MLLVILRLFFNDNRIIIKNVPQKLLCDSGIAQKQDAVDIVEEIALAQLLTVVSFLKLLAELFKRRKLLHASTSFDWILCYTQETVTAGRIREIFRKQPLRSVKARKKSDGKRPESDVFPVVERKRQDRWYTFRWKSGSDPGFFFI